jgi:hypothetical protein
MSIVWAPTWFAYAFLRRIATLEAVISLPARPFPAPAPARQRAPVPAAETSTGLVGTAPR